ncbi:MAG TPA: hypothetical protein PLN21_18480, partial [Gemmatales bacterium]|nr:hypothetical protein [Gemmatales bacterium]
TPFHGGPAMREKPSRLSSIIRFLSGCISPINVLNNSVNIWGQPEDEAKLELGEVKKQFALEATAMDVLAELMTLYKQQQFGIELISRHLKGDNVTASMFNVFRQLTSNAKDTVLSLVDYRDKNGRDRTECPEKQADLAKEKAENAQINWQCQEYQAVQGYHYDHALGITQPGNNLPSMETAIRDIVRMRMLPKSQYEDFMILQLFSALSEDEKKIDPETLCKEEKLTALHNWDPNVHAEPGQTKYKLYEEMSRIIFLQRVQEFNEVYEKAAQHVDGLMDEKQIQPGMRFPFVGLPPIVRKAADGDKEAIAQLQSMVNRAREQTPEYVAKQAQENRNILDLGHACAVGLALLLAFCSVWMCACMILTPTMGEMVMPLEVCEVIELVDQQKNNHKDTKNGAQHYSVSSASASFVPLWLSTSDAFFEGSTSAPISSG